MIDRSMVVVVVVVVLCGLVQSCILVFPVVLVPLAPHGCGRLRLLHRQLRKQREVVGDAHQIHDLTDLVLPQHRVLHLLSTFP